MRVSILWVFISFLIVISYYCGDNDNGKEKENTVLKCSDNQDNDNDGFVDCEDEDCKEFGICKSPSDGGEIDTIDLFPDSDDTIDLFPDSDDTIDTSDASEVDGDLSQEVDTNDSELVCQDQDRDGHGENCSEGVDCNDTDPNNWFSCTQCLDMDRDGYYIGCDAYVTIRGPDCDDSTLRCTTNCVDQDNDRIYDCADDCIDADRDGYGNGNRCNGADCNDNDPNNWLQCGNCRDSDNDGYYVNCDTYQTINGPDCDDTVATCNRDCTTDNNNNGHRDCDESCVDQDRDGYGEGSDCLGSDCDDTVSVCTTDCSDRDSDSVPDCNFCPTTPRLIGSYNTPGYARGVFVVGNYAYVADDIRGLRIVDVTNKRTPQEVGNFDTPGHAWDVYVEDETAFVGDGEGGVIIIDVANKNNPQMLSSLPIQPPGYARTLFKQGNILYIAGGSNGILVADISNLNSPTIIGSFDTQGETYGLYADTTYLYVADGSEGFLILDITVPQNISLIGRYNTIGTAYDVRLIPGTNFVIECDGNRGFNIMNIVDPTSPYIFSSLDIFGTTQKVYLVARYAYIGAGTGGVRIVDISDLNNPREVGSLASMNEEVRGVFVKEGYVYAAAGDTGLKIISVRCQD